MNLRIRRSFLFQILVLLASVAELGSWPESTMRERTLPANHKTYYGFTTFVVKSPTEDAWRLIRVERELGWVCFYHTETEALLAAFWEPVFKHGAREDGAAEAREFFQEQIVKEFELSPDVTIESVENNKPETMGGFEYQSWRMKVTSVPRKDAKPSKDKKPEEKDSQWLVFARSPLPKPDLFVFFLILPAKSVKQQTACEQSLRDLVAGAAFVDYPSAQVALTRTTFAGNRFFREAEKERKQRDADKLLAMRKNASEEAESAIRLQPTSPVPWVFLGQIAEYNQDGLRYGEGFDSTRAEECYRRSIQIRPTYLIARENLAKLYEAVKRNEDAEREWKAAVETEPSNGEFHYRLGRFYQKQDRTREALDCFREALRFWRGAELTRRTLEKEVKELEKKTKAK